MTRRSIDDVPTIEQTLKWCSHFKGKLTGIPAEDVSAVAARCLEMIADEHERRAEDGTEENAKQEVDVRFAEAEVEGTKGVAPTTKDKLVEDVRRQADIR